MYLKSLEINGFKSFAKKVSLDFVTPITAIVGPNGSGKSNTAEAFRFVLGEQSLKTMRGKKGEDLIFTGNAGRMSRASVKVVLDNSHKQFPVDFKEVAIERAVLRDGSNEYILNGSKVRAKDITELLSAAHIGASGHHIISQGEADRIISLSPRDRKNLLEEALGLRIYSLKKAEALRKLEKTDENLNEVRTERKVVAPRLRMLKKEVEKIAEGERLRTELRDLYRAYFPRRFSLEQQKNEVIGKRQEAEREVNQAQQSLDQLRSQSVKDQKEFRREDERAERQSKQAALAELLERISGAQLSLGKIEARIEIQQESKERHEREKQREREQGSRLDMIAAKVQESWVSWAAHIQKRFTISDELHDYLESNSGDYNSLSDEEKELRRQSARNILGQQGSASDSSGNFNESELQALIQRKGETEEMIRVLRNEEDQIRSRILQLEDIISRESSSESDSKIAILELEREQERWQHALDNHRRTLAGIEAQLAEFKNEEVYARDVYGVEVGEWLEIKEVPDDAEMNIREKIQRLKILLENAEVGSSRESIKEYEELLERDQFIEKEIKDLEVSAESLTALIADLTATIHERFETGMNKVNAEFNRFFSTLFSGGKAELKLEALPLKEDEEESDREYGVDIAVSLPNKKISGLSVLSGGERSLTSIALLFAMSAVNPPPFIILDETDAALDEANSKRYGDMVELLSKNSQLILITHNRETMSRADTLYGVTMNREGVSQLLSVKFAEAVAVAK